MKRPMKSATTFPDADMAAPTKKKAVLHISVKRFPYRSDGSVATRLPIQAPMMVREVAT